MLKENWTYKKLGDCFPYIKNGANIKQERGASGIPITRIETLSGGVFNRDRLGYADIFELDKYLDYILSSHDLLMSHINSKAYIGRTVEYISKEQETIIHGMNLLRLKSNPEIINSSFFAYYTHCHIFKSEIAKIRKDAVNQSSFSISDLKKIFIPVPPLETQSRIVSELDLLQSIIDKQQAQLKELDKLAQAVFYDMFGDPVENEKGWEVKKIKDICVDKKEIKRASKYFNQADEIHYIDISSIDNKSNIIIGITTYAFGQAPSRAQQKVEGGDILVSLVRPNLKNIALICDDDDCLVASSGFCVLRTKLASNLFLKSLVLSPRFTKYLTERVSGANYPAIREDDIKDCLVGFPPISLQQSFAAKIEAIEKQKAVISQSMAETQKLFDYTMDKYFG